MFLARDSAPCCDVHIQSFFNNIFAILIHFVFTQVSPLSFTSWPLPPAVYVLQSCVQYMTILHYTCDNRIWSDLSNDKKSTIFKQMFFKLSFETAKIKKAPLKNQGPPAEIFWSVYSWKTFKLSHYCNISKQLQQKSNNCTEYCIAFKFLTTFKLKNLEGQWNVWERYSQSHNFIFFPAVYCLLTCTGYKNALLHKTLEALNSDLLHGKIFGRSGMSHCVRITHSVGRK